MAESIKESTNLTDKDSIHLAEARALGCDIFLTRDRFLIDIAKKYIWAASPDEIRDNRCFGYKNSMIALS